ncbi:ATP-dependent helicase [Rummeliibacillus sp. TYF005]|uniref:ATP-dependent helicase n=1 Tax=unclassified Rummeliibacillus TaxID=2622809 RepID=UPI000E66168E|nr:MULTISPECIES: ATP-dependent helicase [unclassified Rummeliibacillus]RIJ69658.1 ATP-dependent helicase [Rummeliibacillus sp. POC4]RPJ95982.1 ATP-dependent helicase [Rummeliibacillus sp. TYF005]
MNFFEKMQKLTGVCLNEVQQKAVRYSKGPLLLLASPGSGKTTTLNMKIGYLLLVKKVPAHKILAITFSKASAVDMAARFDQFFSSVIRERVHFSTIHSIAFQIVREYFSIHHQNFEIIEGNLNNDFDKKTILRNIFAQKRNTIPSEDEMDELITYCSFVKNRMIPEDSLVQKKTMMPGLVDMYKQYEAFKVQYPGLVLLDFDDMLTYCYKALSEDEFLRNKYQQRFEYILTDESQDNSVIQHEIVYLLAAPQFNICVVADDDQSIFMWRGADVRKLLNFKKIYPNAKTVTMAQNYRSTSEIVDTANEFIKRNRHRYPKKMFTENPAGEPIEIHNLKRYDLQLNYVVGEIQKAEHPSEVAILYRNNNSAILLCNKLMDEGIPFYMKDVELKFFRHWIVEDILNIMRLSYNDSRVDILEKVYTKIGAYIKKGQIQQLQRSASKESAFDRLQKIVHAPYQEQVLKRAKQTIHKLQIQEPYEAIQMIRQKLGYDKSLKNMAEHLRMNEDNLFDVLNTLEQIAKERPDLESFARRLKEIEKLMRTSKMYKGQNVVTLSTLHSSKGLEYDSVYMIDLIEGILPNHEDIKEYELGNTDEMEEATRLFYVGMTRARHHLELLTYNVRSDVHVKESRFVQNVRRIIAPEDVKQTTARKQPKRPSYQVISENAITDESDLSIGHEVEHHLYGVGRITSITLDSIEIDFESVGPKKFMLDFCLSHGYLKRT